jgi:hypothetical protein
MAYGSLPDQPVAGNGAWTSEDTYTARLCFFEGPTYLTLRLKFSGSDLLFNAEYNVAFGAARQPQLIGHGE